MAASTGDRQWAEVGENQLALAADRRQAAVDAPLPSEEAGPDHRDATPRQVGTDVPDGRGGRGEDASRGQAWRGFRWGDGGRPGRRSPRT
jgi:hypothetical protein